MCIDPVSLTAIGSTIVSSIGSAVSTAGAAATAMQGAATAVSATGAIVGGIGQYQQAKYAEEAARIQARDALARGEEAANDHARQVAQLKGQQAAAFAANGVELGFGSALDVLGDTAEMGRMDLDRIRENARREAYGYQISAAGSRAAAGYALAGATLDAGSTLLSGASKTYQSYQKNRPTGGYRATGGKVG